MTPEVVSKLRAVESLRAGVPNRDVVALIPPHQTDIERRFQQLIADPVAANRHGMLIEGDFGSGKSHWLRYFEASAIASGYVCSTVSLNKEVPLYDLAKVYRACILSSESGNRSGAAIHDIVHDYDADRAPGFNDLIHWTVSGVESGILDPRLAASLRLLVRTGDEEVRSELLTEWMGHPMKVGRFREALRSIGDKERIGKHWPMNYPQRFEFLSRLLISRGYKGWIILIDEVETASKYSLRQRAKSYAHLARLIGSRHTPAPFGVAAVATITKDYSGIVLRGTRKHDLEEIPNRLVGTRDEPHIKDAVAGMEMIDSHQLDIRPIPTDYVGVVYGAAAELYSEAYGGWAPPNVRDQREHSATRRMREYIRSWINAWDLRRIYGMEVGEGDMVFETVEQKYDENPDYQNATTDGEEPGITY